jgi:hypothetical protein
MIPVAIISILKKHWKQILFLVLLILLIAAVGIADYYRSKYEIEKKEKESVVALTAHQGLIIKDYKNKNDQLVTRATALEFENKTVRELAESGELKWLQEFEGLKKNLRNLESAYRLQTKVVDSVKVKLQTLQLFYINSHGDTIIYQGMKFNYEDKFASISALQVTPDSLHVKYSVDVPISGTLYWKRKWFLGKKTYQAEVTSANPNVKISDVITFKTNKK